MTKRLITILGPTASGKTSLAAALARDLDGEILSADSRQVYRRMDIGTGKDLADYTLTENGKTVHIPYHLIDICEPGTKYNLFQYQQDFAAAYQDICQRDKWPILCGGTGLYIEAVLKGYQLSPVPQNPALRAELEGKSLEELTQMLRELKAKNGSHMHNTTDVDTAQRAIRAIEIEMGGGEAYPKASPNPSEGGELSSAPVCASLSEGRKAFGTPVCASPSPSEGGELSAAPVCASLSERGKTFGTPVCASPSHPSEGSGEAPLVFGVNIDRELRREKITRRLKARLDEGMVDEIRSLLDSGIPAEDLIYYGLEYKYLTEYVIGRLSYDEMFRQLEIAIHQFAKRQMTWFRGMERRGFTIHWIDATLPMQEKVEAIKLHLFGNER